MLLSKKIKLLFLIFLTGFIGFCFASQIQAVPDPTSFTADPNVYTNQGTNSNSNGIIILPHIYIYSISIDKIGDSQITGQFTVQNDETYYINNLDYQIQLFQGTEFAKLNLVDSLIPSETFFVAPGEKVNKSFTYTYPKNIPNGDYSLRMIILSDRGNNLSWQDQIVSLKGQNKFLQIIKKSSKVLVDGKEYTTSYGPGVDPKTQKAIVYMKIENPGDAITVIPDIKIYQREVNMSVVNEYQDSPITFKKGETKEIKLEMLSPTTPESYLAEVKFLNNNEQVSGTGFFRWVVTGASGKILNVKVDKDYFKAGENIDLTIESIGPADFSNIGTGGLEVSVYDNNKLVGQTSKNVALNSMMVSSIISIPIKKDLIAPRIDVKLITKDGKILDQRTITLPVFSKQAKQIQSFNKYFIYILLAVILLIILVAGFVFYRLKIKYTKFTPTP